MLSPQENVIPGQYILQALEIDFLLPAEREAMLQQIVSAGHTLDSLARQGVQAPLRWLNDSLTEKSPDRAAQFAYRMGENVRLTSHGGLSMMLMASSTVRQTIGALHFLPLLTNTVDASYTDMGEEGGFLMIEPKVGDTVLDLYPVYFAGGAVRRLMQLLTVQPPACTMHIAGSAPDFLRQLPADQAGQWRFEAPTHGIAFARADLDCPCLFADPVTFNATRQNCETELAATLNFQNFGQRVRRFLDQSDHYPDQQSLAERFNMSSSTLKRQLAQSGSSYIRILEESRRQRAITALLAGQLSIQQIAENLGYSDQTNFTHAFKRWTGTSPALLRKRLRGGVPGNPGGE